jgi:hypothetical protein
MTTTAACVGEGVRLLVAVYPFVPWHPGHTVVGGPKGPQFHPQIPVSPAVHGVQAGAQERLAALNKTHVVGQDHEGLLGVGVELNGANGCSELGPTGGLSPWGAPDALAPIRGKPHTSP